MKDSKLFLAASIDVEEEGLFTGKYACINPPLRNISFLSRISALCDAGIKPTLFCAWPVFNDPESSAMILAIRDKHHLDIGCHLHHWNTPPYEEAREKRNYVKNVASCRVDNALMAEKLASLFNAAEKCLGERPRSFRMGRWDLCPQHLELLIKLGVTCDASLRPLHACLPKEQGPDHFNALSDPFWLEGDFGKIFEIPLTVIPMFKSLPGICEKLGSTARAYLKKIGALALLPVYHPLWLMKLVTHRHLSQGGRVLSLTWHSSEMMPGGAPHIPDEKHARELISKILEWHEWLCENYRVESLSMQELLRRLGSTSPWMHLNHCMNIG